MAERPSYFRGKMPTATQLRRGRAKVERQSDWVLRNPGMFTKAIVLGVVAAGGVAALALFGMIWLHAGTFGVWEGWHGSQWNLKDLVEHLEQDGLDFELTSGARPGLANASLVQLEFPGFEEDLEEAKTEEDMNVRIHRTNNLRKANNTVIITRKDATVMPETRPGEYRGGAWQWGKFLFTGDSRRIQEIRAVLNKG